MKLSMSNPSDSTGLETKIPILPFEPGSFGCHEVLHMSLYLAEQVEGQLCDHPAIAGKPEWKKLADKAADSLQELYQALGREHL